MNIDTVGVVGLGTMGAGIAEVFARSGLPVVAIEPEQDWLDRGRGNVERSTARAVERGRMAESARAELLDRIAFTTELGDLAEVDAVVEVIPERIEAKTELFARLDEVCKDGAVLASNTSSLSITEIAAATGRPGAVVGTHFFNPAPVMRLVEVIRGVLTDDATAAAAEELAVRLGKTPITVGDRAGFVANTLLLTYLNRAVALLEGGRADRDDIDTAMRVGAGLPLGPFALIDLVGLDVCVHVLDVVYAETHDRLDAPSGRLRRLVAAGLLGRKTGRGFYTYDRPNSSTATDARAPVDPAPDAVLPAAVAARPVRDTDLVEVSGGLDTTAGQLATARGAVAAEGRTAVVASDRAGGIVDALLMPYLNAAVRMLDSGYATVSDIDTAMTLGCGYPAGPFETIDAIGADVVLAAQREIYAESGEPGLAPSPLLTRYAAAGRRFTG